jgi:hypothetical protein
MNKTVKSVPDDVSAVPAFLELVNQWWLVTHVEDVSPEKLEKRVGREKQP